MEKTEVAGIEELRISGRSERLCSFEGKASQMRERILGRRLE